MSRLKALLSIGQRETPSESYRINDIAHGLARVANSDFQHFYSVAQRSVLASSHAAGKVALDLLLHWSPLAYHPVIRWSHCRRSKEYVELEERLSKQFGYSPQLSFLGLTVDQRLRATERRDLLDGGSLWEGMTRVEPFESKIVPWGPLEAERKFHERFRELTES